MKASRICRNVVRVRSHRGRLVRTLTETLRGHVKKIRGLCLELLERKGEVLRLRFKKFTDTVPNSRPGEIWLRTVREKERLLPG